jgi:F-type H+-transporting ATPase subunit gamma
MEWPPIVETEPAALRRRLARLWLSATFHGIMLESAAAEHSARYQLLEGAAQNAQRMIEELETSLRAARQEAVTAEVQNLSSGAGLVGRSVDSDPSV